VGLRAREHVARAPVWGARDAAPASPGAGQGAPPGPGRDAARGARGAARGRAGGASRGRRKGRGRERGGRERGGEGSSPRVQIRRSPSPKPSALRGRERGGGEEVATREKLNEGKKERREGGMHGEGQGAPQARKPGPGRARPGRAGLGCTTGQKSTTHTTTYQNPIVKRNPKRD
jgi:hypothetical protein